MFDRNSLFKYAFHPLTRLLGIRPAGPTWRLLALCLLFGPKASGQIIYEDHQLQPNDGFADNLFGYSVGISDGIAIVSALKADAAYTFDVATGQQIKKLLPVGWDPSQTFGLCAAISGNIAIVGDHREDDLLGAAYLFDVTTGQQLHKLSTSNTFQLGASVAISGNVAIVGAPYELDNTGAAYLFNVTTGQQIHKLVPAGAASGDRIGWSVGISGDVAIVGAPFSDEATGGWTGSAYLFDVNTGQQIASKLLAGDPASSDRFGWSVGVAGDTAIVGAYWNDDNGTNSGSAYLFDATTGQQISKLLPSDGAADDQFGISVGISGNIAVIGADRNDDNGTNSGSVYLFDVASGQQTHKILASDASSLDYFGYSVGISNGSIIVGAPPLSTTNIEGTAYVLTLDILECEPSGIQWTNAAGGFFSDGMNWAGRIAPGARDSAYFWAGAPYTVTFGDGRDKSNLKAFVNDEVTLALQDQTYSLTESGCPSLTIGAAADGFAKLTANEGTLVAGGDVAIGAANNAAAVLALQSATLEAPTGTVYVGRNTDAVTTSVTQLDVDPDSRVIAGQLVIAPDGMASFERTPEPETYAKIAVGVQAQQAHPDAVGLFTTGMAVEGMLLAERLIIDGAQVTATGALATIGLPEPGGRPLVEVGDAGQLIITEAATADIGSLDAAGDVTVSAGGALNLLFMELFAAEGSEDLPELRVAGPGSRLMLLGTPADDFRVGQADLIIEDGAQIQGAGFVTGPSQTAFGSISIRGAGSGTGQTALDEIRLGDSPEGGHEMGVSENASARVKRLIIGRAQDSTGTLEVAIDAELMTGELELDGNGTALVNVFDGGGLLLGDLLGNLRSDILVDYDTGATGGGGGGSEPGGSAALNLWGAGSYISAHPDLVPDELEAIKSSLRIAGIGRVEVSEFALLSIGNAKVGRFAPGVAPGGLLVIGESAMAEFFEDDGDDNAFDSAGDTPLNIAEGGVMRVETAGAVIARDVLVSEDGELRVTGAGSSLSGTNALVHGGVSGDSSFLNVADGASISLLSLDAVNGAEVVVGDGGLLSTATAHIGGGAFDDQFGPGSFGGNGVAAVAVSSILQPTVWDAGSLVIGGAGNDPNIPDAAGEVTVSGAQATINAGTIVVNSDGRLTGTGTVAAASLSINGGTVGVRVQSSPSPLLGGPAPANTLVIDGSLVATPDSTIRVEIGGPGAGQAGVLTVTGDAAVDGVLELAFVNGYGPSAGTQFDVLAVQGVGTFGPTMTTEVSGLVPGFEYDVQTDPETGVLTVTAVNDGFPAAPCLADIANNDGLVDVDDLNAILSAWGAAVGPGDPRDIANNDGLINVDDLNIVLSNWGAVCD